MTNRVERVNSLVRDYLGQFKRRSKCYSKSIEMIESSLLELYCTHGIADPTSLKHDLPILQGYLLATKSHTYLQQLLDMSMRSYLGTIALACYLG